MATMLEEQAVFISTLGPLKSKYQLNLLASIAELIPVVIVVGASSGSLTRILM